VKPLFRQSDRDTMLAYHMDLWKYDDVSANAVSILQHVSLPVGDIKKMPCDANGAWSNTQIDTFQQWMACGKKYEPNQCTPNDKDMFYKMLNIQAFPEFVEPARNKLKEYLSQAHALGQGMLDKNVTNASEDANWYWAPFKYSLDAFETRMNALYSQLATESVGMDANIVTREQAIFRLLQLGPFNLIDGGWISRCCPTGPIDEVHSLLWGILNDEMGDGTVEHNHCQLYQELLQSCGFYLPKINTAAFVNAPYWLPSAFITPAYALALSYFTNDFFPELLGTTLQIEWTVLSLKSTIHSLKYFDVNPHFFELHVGIDNGTSRCPLPLLLHRSILTPIPPL
jgi:hypothetical protein